MRERVAIGIATCRRPEGLRQALLGLNRLEFTATPEPDIVVLIADNDAAGSARSVAEGLRDQVRWPIHYEIEPQPGVSSVRNRLIAMIPDPDRTLAFLDDDEVPVPRWLDCLLDVSRRFDAGVVVGPVLPDFDGVPPAWVIRGRFFEIGPYEDGQRLSYGYTGNSLMRPAVWNDPGQRFDARYNLTGGEDVAFFAAAERRGFPVFASRDGAIIETVPVARATLRYILKRRYRIGTSLAALDSATGQSLRKRAVRIAKGAGRIAYGLALTPVGLVSGQAALANALGQIAWGAGSIAGVFGQRFEEYAALHT